MLLQFKQAAHVGGKDFGLGVHDVPTEILEDEFLLRLVRAGLVVEPSAAHLLGSQTLAERNQALSDKLMGVKPEEIVEEELIEDDKQEEEAKKSEVKIKKKKE